MANLKRRTQDGAQGTGSATAIVCAAMAAVASGAGAQEVPSPAQWAFDAQAYYYFLPDEPDFLLPILMADRGALRREARYNYEDLRTFSAFAGRSFELGKLTLTPMLGAVVGQTDGVAPAIELDLVAGPFELWVEAEYLFDLNNREDDFFYA
jgi:hypothetical protein